jgi:cytosine/uracil/thiamine/allantoin permease
MLAQRWLERAPVSMDDLYKTDATSRYWYSGGYNLTAIITTALVSVYVMTWHLEISWLVGMPLSLVVYVIIHRLSVMFST